MFLIFDTETTGLPKNWKAPITDSDNWPRMVQLAWQLHDERGALVSSGNYIVRPDGFAIPYNAAKIHGITTERAQRDGKPLCDVLAAFAVDLSRTKYAVGHNVEFDISVVAAEQFRDGCDHEILQQLSKLDTKDLSVDFCQLPGGKGGKYKWPTLTELHQKLFSEPFADAHDAAYDVDATARCFFGLITCAAIKVPEVTDVGVARYQAPQLNEANLEDTQDNQDSNKLKVNKNKAISDDVDQAVFTHLHCHSQF